MPAWANNYIGRKFQDPGFTCWDLVVKVYKEVFNVHLNDFSWAYKNVTSKVIPDIIVRESAKWQDIASGQEQAGDVIVLRIKTCPWHVGVVTFPGTMLHCEQKVNTCIEKYNGLTWGKKVVGFYRYDNI